MMVMPSCNLTFFEVVDICDNAHLRRGERGLYDTAYHDELLVPLYLNESPASAVIGLLRPVIIEQLKYENRRSRENGLPETWFLRLDRSEYITSRTVIPGPSVSFRTWLDTPAKRTAAMKEL